VPERITQYLFEALDSLHPPDSRPSNNDSRKQKVKKLLGDLYGSDANDICPHFGYRHLLPFNRPGRRSIIHTNLGVAVRFQEMLRDARSDSHPEGWDFMLGVSETGKIIEKVAGFALQNYRADVNVPLSLTGNDAAWRRRAALVVADAPSPKKAAGRLMHHADMLIPFNFSFRNARSGNGEDPVAVHQHAAILPFWAHNHHMIVFCKLVKDNDVVFEPVRGISFRKRGITNRINPIYLDDSAEMKDDLNVLVNTFLARL
jgi:hypothetical protein